MKSYVFWEITPCSPFKINRRVGRAYRLHLQGWWVSQARYQRETGSKQSKKRRNVPPKHRLTFNRLHGVISRKITTAVRTSDFTWIFNVCYLPRFLCVYLFVPAIYLHSSIVTDNNIILNVILLYIILTSSFCLKYLPLPNGVQHCFLTVEEVSETYGSIKDKEILG
jgi:hypothetical protein